MSAREPVTRPVLPSTLPGTRTGVQSDRDHPRTQEPASVPGLPGPTRSGSEPALLAGIGVAAAGALLAGWVLLGPGSGTPVGGPARPPAASEPAITDARPQSALVTSATSVLEAWSHRQLSYPWWWAELRPLLSPGARAAYAHTDPEQLPTLGEVRPVEQRRSGDTATVWFRTDAGRFGVDLSRSGDGGAPWRAHRILFPGQESMFR